MQGYIENFDQVHPRRRNRMVAVQCLYGWDLAQEESLNAFLSHFFQDQSLDRKEYHFAETLVIGTLKHIHEIDQLIASYTQNWSFKRIAKVDLAILRLALYELEYREDIPPIVSINEALDLAGIFSHPDAKRFINGILDRHKAQLKRPLRTAVKNPA